MQRKGRLHSAISLMLSFVLIFSMMASGATVVASASSSNEALKELNAEYEQLKKEQQAIQNQINQAQSEKAKQLAQKKSLNNQINLTQKEINVLEEKIKLLEADIAQKEAEIAALKESIAKNYDLYKQRLSAMYKTGNTSMLGVALGAESFSEFLMRAELLKRVAEHDQALLDSLNADREQLETVTAELNADKDDLASTKAEVEQKKQQLNSQLSQTESKIHDIAALEQQLKEDAAAYQAKMKAIQDEIDAIYRELASTGEFVGGSWAWPVPGYTNISSEFGYRFGGSDYHTGMDISTGSNSSNIYGKSIVASNAGKVVYVKHGTTGYGKYLIIDHGGGYTTLYAHTSSILVSVGDVVSRGQVIAKVGSTGWSTGPHLHFEIRINGVAKNPRNYL